MDKQELRSELWSHIDRTLYKIRTYMYRIDEELSFGPTAEGEWMGALPKPTPECLEIFAAVRLNLASLERITAKLIRGEPVERVDNVHVE